MKSFLSTFFLWLLLINYNPIYSSSKSINAVSINEDSILFDFNSSGRKISDFIFTIRPSTATKIPPTLNTEYIPNLKFINTAETGDSFESSPLSFSGDQNQIIIFKSEKAIFNVSNLIPETFFSIDCYLVMKDEIEFVESFEFTTLALKPEQQVMQLQASSITTNGFRILPYGADSDGILVSISTNENEEIPQNGKSYSSSSEFGEGDEISDGVFVVMSDDMDNQSAVNISNLKPGTMYYVNSFAFNGKDASSNYRTDMGGNNAISIATKLETPILNKLESSSKNAFAIAEWTKVEGATRYFVFVALDPDFIELDENYGRMQLGNKDSYEFDEFEPNTMYYIRIQASNSVALSEFSNVMSFQN